MTRRERLERKLERRREWAEKAETRSDSHFSTAHRMLDAIPLGQPILIGHHSEKRDRNYRNRAAGHMDKGCELSNLAKHHESKADGLEHQLDKAIFSDDSDALDALEIRIQQNETKRAHMKEINRLYRKGDAASLAGYGVNLDELRKKLEALGPYFGQAPHMPFELQNLGARITSDRKRLEFIKKQNEQKAEAEAAPNGVILKQYGDYCSVRFAEKPERAILDALRNAGFHWGSGTWSGYASKLPESVKVLVQGAIMKKHYPSWLDSVDVEAIPVQICGTGTSVRFRNLAEARQTFPELDPYTQTAHFTWAMRGEINGQPALRFETWKAERMFSA